MKGEILYKEFNKGGLQFPKTIEEIFEDDIDTKKMDSDDGVKKKVMRSLDTVTIPFQMTIKMDIMVLNLTKRFVD